MYLTDTQTSQEPKQYKDPKMMRKRCKKAEHTAREGEYEKDGLTANFVSQNTANKCSNQPASEHQGRGKR